MDDAKTTGDGPGRPPALAVIACAVMETEVEHLAAGMDHIVAYEKLEQGLHNEPDRLRRVLQETVDRLEDRAEVEAIALVYGLCSRGIEGVRTRRCTMVVARAHDCITLLLGSRHRYARYVAEHPGTYWYSPGWNRHHLPPGPQRYEVLRAEYEAKYGQDNAAYLMQTEQHWFTSYQRAVYVHLSVGATDADRQFTRDCADWLKWEHDEQAGDPDLLRRLLAGQWDEGDFVVLGPGEGFRMTADQRVIRAQTAEEAGREGCDD